MKVKNISGIGEVYCGMTIADGAEYVILATEIAIWRVDEKVLSHIAQGKLSIHDGTQYLLSSGTALTYFLDQSVKKVSVNDTPPFSAPTHRTKRAKTSELITIAPSSSVNVDYQITSERYATGGGVVYTGAEIGDYVTAEVYDKDGVIPEAYRAALCESWPSVAKYIEGEWVPKGEGRYEINTYPLNARITAGLYLRITYNSCATGGNRVVGVNYYLTKKL